MKYLAHISDDKKREQTILDHLEGTAELSGKFAKSFGYEDWGYCCGKLHDIGKYSEKFQERIHGSNIRVDHATAGARVCKEIGGFYTLLAYCIAGHHAGLPDTGESVDTGDRATFIGRMKKRLEEYGEYRKEIDIPELKTPPLQIDRNKDPSFTIGFFIRMLYSCLVDADYLDTEDFMSEGKVERQSGDEMKVLWRKIQDHISGWMENKEHETINGRRTEILKACIESALRKKGLFRLTVPTGGGKTIASLAFALRHAAEHGLEHIIYVIPYTSIIEQNAKVFQDILGYENVLEHHCNVDYASTEELIPMQLATENWDKPVVVTTNVQFFESLFSNKSSKCRKLHNIANSVIIFDEAQMLPNDYLKPCIQAIEELITYYKCSIVLCTATQPALGQFFSEDNRYQELCPRVEEQFRFFKRSAIENLDKISEETLVEKLKREYQALCIVNTKKSAQKLYQAMSGEGVFHLSTFMYPAHRKHVLKKIRARLEAKEKCILISTSLVEAGVDLDFQNVYRQLAGIDSVIQAAGRCNREGKRAVKDSHTYIFQLEDEVKVVGQEQQIDTAKKIIREFSDISMPEAIQEYFTSLYKFRGEGLDKKKILEQFNKGRFPFATVGEQFKLMEQNTKTIFIAREDRAKEIVEEIKHKGITKALMREAGQYCVDVYDDIFRKIHAARMLTDISEELTDDFFLLRNADDYSDEIGLKIDVELGAGIWY